LQHGFLRAENTRLAPRIQEEPDREQADQIAQARDLQRIEIPVEPFGGRIHATKAGDCPGENQNTG
jgi:hypothetical protein